MSEDYTSLTTAAGRRNHRDADRPVRTVTVERQTTGWIIVALDGHVVFRRLTRDPLFTRVFLSWPSNGSPNPRTLGSFARAELGGAWRPRTAQIGTAFDLPPVGERWHYRRQPDQERTAKVAFPREGGWVRDGLMPRVF